MNEMSSAAKRALAVLFVVIVVAFVAGSVLVYRKTFVPVDRVDLYTDRIGFALPQDADVKVRGVVVGQVRDIQADGSRVKVTLAIEPGHAENLPGNVTARLLPKTLFGERYVDLALPEHPQSTLAEVDTIAQDSRGDATELGRVLDGLLPVLEAVPPAKLAQTLGALNQALDGNGQRLGASLAELGKVFDGVVEVSPQLESGLRDLATFSTTYAEAAPELVNALDALRTTGNTVVGRRDDIADGLRRIIADVPTVTRFLEANRQDVISLAADSYVSLGYLGRYSPSLPCAVRQFHTSYERSDAILGVGKPNPGIRVNVEIVNPRGRYLPNQDEPRAFESRGPKCYPDGGAADTFPGAPGGSYSDGAYQPPMYNPGPQDIPDLPNPLDEDPAVTAPLARGGVAAAPGRAVPERTNDPIPDSARSAARSDDGQTLAYAGSPVETDTVRTIYAAAGGTDADAVPSWVAGLGAPALRGAEVSVR